jgi:hypothetical protein
MDLIELLNPTINRPGIGSRVLIAELAHITTFGAFATNTNPGDEFRITGDHVFDTGKGFVPWETEDDVANLKIPVTGATSSLGYKPELSVFLPGLDPARLWSAVQNKKLIVLVSAFGCNAGQFVQLGDVCNPARFMPSDGFNSGTAGGNDARGFSLKIGSNFSVYAYEGDVTMYP